MIEAITGSRSRERVLVYIAARNKAYAREIAAFYKTSLSPVQNQLNGMELAGILVSKQVGKTRVFFLNPRYAFCKELKALLEKVIEFLPEEQKTKLLNIRTRPRRQNKPY